MPTVSESPFHFLIVGAGRGGTSLLTGLLDSHSRLEVGFEKFSIDFLMGQKMPRRSWFRGRGNGRLIHDRVSAFKRACLSEARSYPGQLWGNKITTEQIYGLEDHNRLNAGAGMDILDFFFHKSLPESKVIFILRDGRTCVRSKVNRTGQSIELACARWKFSVQVYKYLAERHLNNVVVRFENLLQQPVSELSRICDFLGVNFEEKMLDGTMNPKIPPEYRQDSIAKAKLAALANDEEWHSLIAEDLSYCGYLSTSNAS
jgi:LPS sulfotransferase NodH